LPVCKHNPAGGDDRQEKVVLDAMAGRISEDVARPLFEEATK
jgi:hypothetical protein